MLGGQETASSIGRFPLGEWEGGGGGGGGERRVIASLWSYTTHIVHGGPLQFTHFLYKSFPPPKKVFSSINRRRSEIDLLTRVKVSRDLL